MVTYCPYKMLISQCPTLGATNMSVIGEKATYSFDLLDLKRPTPIVSLPLCQCPFYPFSSTVQPLWDSYSYNACG